MIILVNYGRHRFAIEAEVESVLDFSNHLILAEKRGGMVLNRVGSTPVWVQLPTAETIMLEEVEAT